MIIMCMKKNIEHSVDKYNKNDDGKASQRVIDRILELKDTDKIKVFKTENGILIKNIIKKQI